MHLRQEEVTFVAMHMLYGAGFFCFLLFSIIVLLESIGAWLIVLHTVIDFSEAGKV